MLLGIIFVKIVASRANKMFISEHQRYTGPATGNSAICPDYTHVHERRSRRHLMRQ